MARVTGRSIFQDYVAPYLKKAAKESGEFRGVLRKEVHSVPDVKVTDSFQYTRRPRGEYNKLRAAFDNGAREDFLKGMDEEKLVAHGFSKEDIATIRSGRPPEGYQVHHKAPLDDSGTNDKSNLILIKNSREHQLITNHQKWATENLEVGQTRVVDWPVFPDDAQVWPKKRRDETTVLPNFGQE